MKYIGAAMEQIAADFWGAVLGAHIPVFVVEYIGRVFTRALGERYGPEIAFVLVHIPGLCLIVLLVAESGDVDFAAL